MNADALQILFSGAVALVVIGATGLVLASNLFRRVIALAIAEAGANLLLVLAGYRPDAVAPIIEAGRLGADMVDPVPQAMVLTAIVIGVGVQALALAVIIRIRNAYGTLDMREVRRRLAIDLDRDAGLASDTAQHLPGEPSRGSEVSGT